MSGISIVLASDMLARYPEGGGLWAAFLQYPLALRALGHKVLWLETLVSTRNPDLDGRRAKSFLNRMRKHGLENECIVAVLPTGDLFSLEDVETHGASKAKLFEAARSADVLWNLAASLGDPLLSLFRKRVLIDVDPGHFQVSGMTWDFGVKRYDAFLTVGLNLHEPDCQVPTLGVHWRRFLPLVHLPFWDCSTTPSDEAPYTSVTQWNWGELWMGDRVLSIAKRDAYLRYSDLPNRANRSFQLAANFDPEDQTGDRDIMVAGGWDIVNPHELCCSPADYQQFILQSRAEISCPKPIFRELRTGWFSDRSAGYLASGRPVLAEDTGFSLHLPVGEGLIAFNGMAQAIAGIESIDANYQRHAKAARELAEDVLNARTCISGMLEASG